MSDRSVPELRSGDPFVAGARHVLYRLTGNEQEWVATYPSFGEGWSAGQALVHSTDGVYFLKTIRGRTVARFGTSRVDRGRGEAGDLPLGVAPEEVDRG